MRISIDRKWKKPNYTISNLYVDGKRFTDGKQYCNVLEDTDRGLTSDMTVDQVLKKKVYGQTAIPKGEYVVTITYSTKFKRDLPLLNAVKGFTGVRIHSGNSAKNTLGCILVGRNDNVGWVSNSRYWFGLLFDKIKQAIKRGEKVTFAID